MRRAQGLNFILGQQPDHTHLRFGRQMIDLVEKHSTALGLLQYADAAVESAGKGVFFMPE